MIVLLAPAKQIDMNRVGHVPFTSIPKFIVEAQHIMMEVSTMRIESVAKSFHVSRQLALNTLNWAYSFNSPESDFSPAIIAFNGVAFKPLNAFDFSNEDFLFAQSHLRIGSGCYGLLRPLDAIHAYRLEFLSHLDGFGKTMQDFWREKITSYLLDDLKLNDNILINLASDETFNAFDLAMLQKSSKVVNVHFKKISVNGYHAVNSVLLKKLRGAMTRFIIKHRLQKVEELRFFESSEVTYNEDASDEFNITFIQDGEDA